MSYASPFLSSIDKASAQCSPSQILVRGRGCIAIFPQQQAYATDIEDLDSIAPLAGEFAHSDTGHPLPPRDHLFPLPELRWRAAYNFARGHGQLDEKLPLLVRLRAWPDLAEAPAELAPAIARLCGLLACKPTASILLPRTLGTEEESTLALLRVLLAWGHVASMECPAAADASSAAGARDAKPAAAGTILSKLWQRLTAGRR